MQTNKQSYQNSNNSTTELPSTQDLVKGTKLLSKNRRFEVLRKLAFYLAEKNKISFEKYCDTSKRLKIIIESNWCQFSLITNKYKLL